jgi:serine/threonine protein kinase
MEFVQGGDLSDSVKGLGRLLTETEASIISLQVGQALQYMHKLDFVHRDVKPQVISPNPTPHPK